MKKLVILLIVIFFNMYSVSANTDFLNGNAYINNNAEWDWKLTDLLNTEDPVGLGAENSQAHALKKTECLNSPNDYFQICLDSLTVGEKSYRVYSFVVETQDLSPAGGDWGWLTAAMTLHMATSKTGGFEIQGQSTDDIWLYLSDGKIEVFYENSEGNPEHAMQIDTDSKTEIANIIYSSTELAISLEDSLTTNPNIIITEPSESELSIVLGIEEEKIAKLGNTKYQEEASELTYSDGNSKLTIGHKDENHRTLYGIKIRDPKTHGSQDQVLLDVPLNQVKAKILIKGTNGEISVDVPIGELIVNSDIGETIDNSRINSLLDGTGILGGAPVQIHETVELENTISIETSLSSSKDEYQSDVILEIPKKTVTYYYNLDNPTDLSQISESNLLNIQILGDFLTIYGVQSSKISTTICSELWSCTKWSECNLDLQQTRSCTDIYNCGTIDNKPEEEQTCSECSTNWQCDEWAEQCIAGEETRTCTDTNSCETDSGKPVETRTCNCLPTWACTPWSTCYRGEQKRACIDNNKCGTDEGKPGVKKECPINGHSTQNNEVNEELLQEEPEESQEEEEDEAGILVTRVKVEKDDLKNPYSKVIWLIVGILGGGILAYLGFLIKETRKTENKWFIIGPLYEKGKMLKPKEKLKKVGKKIKGIKPSKIIPKSNKLALKDKIKKSLSKAGWKQEEIDKAMKDLNSKPKSPK